MARSNHCGKIVHLVGTYVDDCAVAGRQKDVNWLKSKVKKFFTIKELGLPKKHLGVWYKWGNDGNGRFLLSSMEDFFRGMINVFIDLFGRYPKHAETPGLPGTSLTKNDDDTLLHGEYRSMVGKILFRIPHIVAPPPLKLAPPKVGPPLEHFFLILVSTSDSPGRFSGTLNSLK